MTLDTQILINKYAQEIVDSKQLLTDFASLELQDKRSYLSQLSFMINQSKPNFNDVESAIIEGKLKSSYTPCVLLSKGYTQVAVQRIIELPEHELEKALVLFLSLFKIAYQRRFKLEKDDPDKWWYWDLSDENKIKIIKDI